MTPAANLTLLYGRLPLEDRFSAAREDGFAAVEIQFPYDREPQWYVQQLSDNGLRLVLINTPKESDTAPWGRAALTSQRDQFRRDFARAAEFCDATGCPAVHVMAGLVAPQQAAEGHDTLLANLDWAVTQYPGLTLLLEGLNSHDVPGYLYSTPGAVRQVLSDVGAESVGMQFDFYHVLREGLGVQAELEASLPWIRHVQVAGNPERQEPDLARDAGVLAGFQRLSEAGYRGCVGYEYRPAGRVRDGLRWADALFPYFS